MKFLKYYLITLASISLTFFWSIPAHSSPYYYTVSGEGYVYGLSDQAGIIAGTNISNLQVGDNVSVSYTFLIDLEADGYVIRNDGSKEVFHDYIGYDADSGTNFVALDYFYCKLISGTILNEKDGGYYNAANDIAEYCLGTLGFGNPRFSETMDTHLRSQDNDLFLWCDGPFFSKDDILKIGLPYHATERVYSADGTYSAYGVSDIHVTSISPAPVSEPTTLLLLGTGLLGLAGFRKRLGR